MVEKPLLPCVT